MLTADATDYMSQDITDIKNAAMHYHQAWCLVHMLGQDGRLKKEIIRVFVKGLAKGLPPMKALPLLTGMENTLNKASCVFARLEFGDDLILDAFPKIIRDNRINSLVAYYCKPVIIHRHVKEYAVLILSPVHAQEKADFLGPLDGILFNRLFQVHADLS